MFHQMRVLPYHTGSARCLGYVISLRPQTRASTLLYQLTDDATTIPID